MAVPVTKEGFEKLSEELRHLKKVERPDIIKKIAEARSHGDLSENAEYHAAKEKQGFIEGRIAKLEGIIADSEVIDISKIKSDKVTFGATVTLEDVNSGENFTYMFVGEPESDPKNGKISLLSPVGQAVLGKTEGDEVRVQAPAGLKEYEIVEIKYI
ncbi:MAG: transcription elongation factor GreA [bacterium]